MWVNPCLICAGIVPAIHVGSTIMYYPMWDLISQVQLLPVVLRCLHPVSPPSRLALLCGNQFGAQVAYLGVLLHFYLVYIALCLPILLVTPCSEHVNVYLVLIPVPLMLLCLRINLPLLP